MHLRFPSPKNSGLKTAHGCSNCKSSNATWSGTMNSMVLKVLAESAFVRSKLGLFFWIMTKIWATVWNSLNAFFFKQLKTYCLFFSMICILHLIELWCKDYPSLLFTTIVVPVDFCIWQNTLFWKLPFTTRSKVFYLRPRVKAILKAFLYR